jgi:hypothetical protein
MKPIICLTLIITICYTSLFAQKAQTDTTLNHIGFDLKAYSWLYFFRHAHTTLDTFRLKGAVCVRFKIDSTGTPTDILCNKTAHPCIARFVTEMLQSTKDRWQNALAMKAFGENEYFLLPVYYTLQRKGPPAEEFGIDKGFKLYEFDTDEAPTRYIVLPAAYFDTNGRGNMHLLSYYRRIVNKKTGKK